MFLGATPADSATLFKQWAYQQVNFVEWDDMYLSLTNFPNRTATLKVSLPTDETAAYWQSLLDDVSDAHVHQLVSIGY